MPPESLKLLTDMQNAAEDVAAFAQGRTLELTLLSAGVPAEVEGSGGELE